MRNSLILTLASLLAFGFQCFAQSAGKRETATARSGKSREGPLIANEKRLWETLKTKDADGFNRLVDEGASLIDARGSMTPSEFLPALADVSLADYSLSDMKVTRISRGAALVTYIARGKILRKGQESYSPPHYNATVWAKRRGEWVIIFHQSTPMPPQIPRAS